MTLAPCARSLELLAVFTNGIFLELVSGIQSDCVDYGYMIMTNRRDGEVLVI